VDDWDFGKDGLHINRRGARHLSQLYSKVCGIGGGRHKMSYWLCLAVGHSSERSYDEMGMTTTQENSTSDWKPAESYKMTSNPSRRETENEANEECV